MKKTIVAFLIAFSFLFMKNNVFADTVTCKYSLSNVSRKIVAFDNYGKAFLNSGAQSEITDKTDQNLVMTITDPADGVVSNLGYHIKFSVEGSKFTLVNAATSHDLTKTYDIYYYKVNGEYAQALTALKQCPQLGVLFEENGTNKYKITNISANSTGSNIADLVRVYKAGYSCVKPTKLLCYYSSNDQNQVAVSYEILANKDQMGLYKMINSSSSVTYDKNDIRLDDFKCSSGYYCPPSTYYVISGNANISSPATYEVPINTSIDPSSSVKKVQYVNSYAISSTPYFMKVSLYDPEKNSGKSGNPEKNNTNTKNNNGNSKWIDNAAAFTKPCDVDPDSAACRGVLSTDLTPRGTFSFCDEKGVLKTLKIVNIVITISKILVPILLIVFGSIEYGKAALADNQDALEKTTQVLIKKVIVGVMIFMIPTIINSIISFSQSGKDKADSTTGPFTKCALCFAGDKSCDSYINSASN